MANHEDKPYQAFDSFEGFFKQAEQRTGYWVERAKIEFTEEILAQMKVLGFNRTQLAASLDAQPALVTRLLNGRNNFELATMVRIARALNCEFRCHLQPVGTHTCWINVLNEEPAERVPVWNPSEFGSSVVFNERFTNESQSIAA